MKTLNLGRGPGLPAVLILGLVTSFGAAGRAQAAAPAAKALPESASAPAAAPAPPASTTAATPESAPASAPAPSAKDVEDFTKLLGGSGEAAMGGGTGGGTTLGGVVGAALPNISAIGNFYAAYFSGDPTFRFGHDPASTGFGLQELEIGIQSVVDPFFRADIFLSINFQEGLDIEEAYLTSLFAMPLGLQLRIGEFLTKFGRFNPRHLETWTFADQPLPYRRFIGGEGLRALGIEVSSLLPLPIYTELIVAVQNSSNEQSFGGTDSFLGSAGVGFMESARLAFAFGGVDDAFGGTFGFSAAAAPNVLTAAGFTERSAIFGADFFIRIRPRGVMRWVDVTAEYLLRTAQVPGALVVEGGFYGEVAWRITRNYEVALRGDHVGAPGAVVYDPARPTDPYTPADETRGTAAFTFYPSEFVRLRLQYSIGLLEGRADNPYNEAMVVLKFNVGPHGAHPF
ncbi:MAG TPA: hypothetical protein VG389_08435 [Myxococcota bacterium]|jgi:hypothetical protein|nr:hypothetical protein [Myxococcota bacterium]